MNCPDTPNTVINKLLDRNDRGIWERSWKIFYEIYYTVMIAMVKNSFAKIGINRVSDNDANEVISNVFVSLLDSFENGKYIKGKYRFRGFLKRIVFCRTIDFVRAQNRKLPQEVKETYDKINTLDEENATEAFKELEISEYKAYRYSLILDIWENIRPAYSPQTCLAFEMTKLEGIPVENVCKKLQITREKVDKSVHRIIKKIKEEKDKEFYKKELEK